MFVMNAALRMLWKESSQTVNYPAWFNQNLNDMCIVFILELI